jgi:hypothetical protein
MNAATVRAELEQERSWRSDELRLLKNQLSTFSEEDDRAIFRRALVVMLYAHFEGFCRNALSVYVKALNAEGLLIRQVNWSLAASSLFDVFNKLHDKDRRSKIFKKQLPEDAQLHRYCRDREFLEALQQFEDLPLVLDGERLTSAESNLKPEVLRKLLFRLGLDHHLPDKWSGSISLLLGRRNNIAHGATRAGVDAGTYEDYERAANAMMDELVEAIFQCVLQQDYQRSG